MQAAVEAEHHLLVGHDVVMTGSDRAQLSPMAAKARDAAAAEQIEVVADRGYYSGQEVLACDRAGIAAHVPKTITSNAVADGRFGKEDFVYVPSSDSYAVRPARHSRITARPSRTASASASIGQAAAEPVRMRTSCTTGK